MPIHVDGEEASSATPAQGNPSRQILSESLRGQFAGRQFTRRQVTAAASFGAKVARIRAYRGSAHRGTAPALASKNALASVPRPAANEQRSLMITTSQRTKQGRPLRPRSLRNDSGRLNATLVQWSDIEHPTRDNVDMPVPSNYSAAPSGDLCTTYKFRFVVWGESRRSVSIASERPQPLRPTGAARSRPPFHMPTLSRSGSPFFVSAARVVSAAFSAMPRARLAIYRSAAVSALELPAPAANSAKSGAGEQMKHVVDDTERRREEAKVRGVPLGEHSSYRWLNSPLMGHASLREGLPRNSFFT